MTAVLSLAAIVAGAWIGLSFPDVDQRTDLLLHRSIITHGPLLPLIGYLLLRGIRHPPVRMFAMAVCLGFTVHLAFDLFPTRWAGYALISIPIYGWVPSGVSILWMGAGAALCAYWAVRLVSGLTEAFAFVLLAMVTFTVAASGERTVLGPLIMAVSSVLVGWMASLSAGAEDGTGGPETSWENRVIRPDRVQLVGHLSGIQPQDVYTLGHPLAYPLSAVPHVDGVGLKSGVLEDLPSCRIQQSGGTP